MASKKAKMARTVSIDEITVPDEYGHPTCAREFYDSALRMGLHCMTWREAWNFLKNGVPVKRVAWMGYWAMESGKLVMHCKDGTIVTLDKCDEPFTLENLAQNDWVPVTQSMKDNLDMVHAAKCLAYKIELKNKKGK